MKSLIAGLSSIVCRHLRRLYGEVQILWAFFGLLGLGLPMEDIAETGLRYANGAIGKKQMNYNQRPVACHLEIFDSEGTLHRHYAHGFFHFVHATSDDWPAISPLNRFEHNRRFLDELRYFLEVAHGEEELAFRLDDGKQVLELVLAALESDRISWRISFEMGVQ